MTPNDEARRPGPSADSGDRSMVDTEDEFVAGPGGEAAANPGDELEADPRSESPPDPLGEPLGPEELAELHTELRRYLEQTVARPFEERLDDYVAALEAAVAAIAELGDDGTGPREDREASYEAGAEAGSGAGAEAGPGRRPETDPGAAVDDGPDPDDATPDQVRTAAHRRRRYTDRFMARFGPHLFDEAVAARDSIFRVMDRLTQAPVPVPDTVRALASESAEPAPDLVRPGWTQRLAGAIRRPDVRAIPVRLLAELYLAELSRLFEPVANDTGRLLAVAVARIRREFHEHTEMAYDEDAVPEDLRALADGLAAEVGRIVEEVQDAFGRALSAQAIDVPERRVAAMRDQAVSRRARLLEDWSAFETALMSNVASENVLARALARLEAEVAVAARRLESIRDAHGVVPLEELVDGLRSLADRAETELPAGDHSEVLPRLARRATSLFDTELPRIERLREQLEGRATALVETLDEIPGQVPDDLQISENPVPHIPPRPRTLQVREAPLEELLRTACTGTIPRWLERSLTAAGAELDAMNQELQRVRNAVDFHLQAPLRGGFDHQETMELVGGITERTIGQLEDLRSQGLASVDQMVTGLEEEARKEAAALRSAVANREFLRIHSEIAEEQAVRRLSTGLDQVRDLLRGAGRGLGRTWGGAGSLITAVQDWAERQLGVGEVEREEMLESLEQSLLGEDQQVVALPAMYRQLFDVEAGVPWDELLVPRDEELAVLQRAYDRWREDRPATVAVVGEKGSGKTTLIHLARKSVLAEAAVVSTGLGRTIDSPDELGHRLRTLFGIEADADLVEAVNAGPPTVAVIEDLHNLFIRTLGGFEAMEQFLEIVAATRRNVLWVVTMEELAWRFLDRAVGLDAHFTHTISTTDLSAERLEQAIMARHDVSGFALRFETRREEPEARGWRRLFRREPRGELTRKEQQRRRYFQDLAAIAEGNIVMALFHWLRSIQRIEEHVLVMGSPEMIDLEFLERLPLPQLHTIAATILHGGISQDAHQRIFQIPTVESRLQLAALADSHIIFLAGDGEYKINKVLYRPFIRLLAAKNIF